MASDDEDPHQVSLNRMAAHEFKLRTADVSSRREFLLQFCQGDNSMEDSTAAED
jgi:hypothetical protein